MYAAVYNKKTFKITKDKTYSDVCNQINLYNHYLECGGEYDRLSIERSHLMDETMHLLMKLCLFMNKRDY